MTMLLFVETIKNHSNSDVAESADSINPEF